MKEEVIKDLNYGLKTQKKTIKAMAEHCGVTRTTMTKLVNKGIGTIALLEKAKEFLEVK